MYMNCSLTLPLRVHREGTCCDSGVDIGPDLVQKVDQAGQRSYTDRLNHIDHKLLVVLDKENL